MRWVDHWVGLPLCFTFGLLATAARKILPRRKVTLSGERSLAVLKFFGRGSILEATPMLKALRNRYPHARLVFVTFDSNEVLLRRLNICTDLRIIRTTSPLQFIVDVLAQVVWLRRHRVEAVIDLEFFSKFSTLLAFLSGAKIRVGFHLNDFWRYSLVTCPIYFNYFHHLTDVYEQAAQRLDAQITDRKMSLFTPTDIARRSAEQFLRQCGWTPGAPLLGVNVNAGDLSLERRWPIANFAEMVRLLLEEQEDLYVVLTGSPPERAYVVSLVDRLPTGLRGRVIVAAGQWSLEEFAAALSMFDGFVTNDSGPLHLGASLGVPMVSIWGPSRPEFYAPRVDNLCVIYANYPCSPCVGMFTTFEGMWCDHEAWCMQTIEPSRVLGAVQKMLAEARAKRRADSLLPSPVT